MINFMKNNSIKLLFLISISLLLFSFFQKEKEKNVQTKLYFSLGEYGNSMRGLMKNKSIQDIKYVNDAQFMTGVEYVFDEQKLKSEIDKSFPLTNDSGIAYIDLEAPYIDRLQNPKDALNFNKSIQLYVSIIKAAKKYRPNVKWGYYYIPLTSYWDKTEAFYNKNQKDLSPIIKECDVLFPSLYTFYDQALLSIPNEQYLKRNVEECIKVGLQYNKPVLAFVWHRYHPSNKNFPMEIIPDSYWKKSINDIVTTSYNNHFLDGIVWWGSDNFFFNAGEKGHRKEFKGTSEEYKKFNDKILIHKAAIVLDQLHYYDARVIKKKQIKKKKTI